MVQEGALDWVFAWAVPAPRADAAVFEGVCQPRSVGNVLNSDQFVVDKQVALRNGRGVDERLSVRSDAHFLTHVTKEALLLR